MPKTFLIFHFFFARADLLILIFGTFRLGVTSRMLNVLSKHVYEICVNYTKCSRPKAENWLTAWMRLRFRFDWIAWDSDWSVSSPLSTSVSPLLQLQQQFMFIQAEMSCPCFANGGIFHSVFYDSCKTTNRLQINLISSARLLIEYLMSIINSGYYELSMACKYRCKTTEYIIVKLLHTLRAGKK